MIVTMDMEAIVSNKGNKNVIYLSYMQCIVVSFKLKCYNVLIIVSFIWEIYLEIYQMLVKLTHEIRFRFGISTKSNCIDIVN